MKKHRKGNKITSVESCLEKEFIIFNDKVYHNAWFRGWQTGWLVSKIKSGEIFEAVPAKHKTIFEDFLEKYPDAELDHDGCPAACPSAIGYKNIGCPNKSCKECWSQAVRNP